MSLALPPVGWQRTVEQPAQTTTVWAWEKTVVMVKQPGHLTSMKKERGAGTRVYLSNPQHQPSNPGPWWTGISVSYLKLVLASLSLRRRVDEVDRENLFGRKKTVLAGDTLMSFGDEKKVQRRRAHDGQQAPSQCRRPAEPLGDISRCC